MSEQPTTGPTELDLLAVASRAAAGDFSALGTILRALEDEDPAIRLRAASLAGEIGAENAIEPLTHMVAKDALTENRIEACYALTGVGRPAGVGALIVALGDDRRECREEARIALYRLLGTGVLRQLADDAFDEQPDPDERRRVSAWWTEHEPDFDGALVYAYGRPASPRVFIDELAVTRTDVPGALYAALRDWTGEDFGDRPRAAIRREWEAWWADHGGKYMPGTRYFHGHPVPPGPRESGTG